MPNGKYHGHDGLTKEFYEQVWYNLKFCFIKSLKQCKIGSCLPISQRQGIIKLMTKNNREKTVNQFPYLMLT